MSFSVVHTLPHCLSQSHWKLRVFTDRSAVQVLAVPRAAWPSAAWDGRTCLYCCPQCPPVCDGSGFSYCTSKQCVSLQPPERQIRYAEWSGCALSWYHHALLQGPKKTEGNMTKGVLAVLKQLHITWASHTADIFHVATGTLEKMPWVSPVCACSVHLIVTSVCSENSN